MTINEFLSRYCKCCYNANRGILDDNDYYSQQLDQAVRPYSNLVTPVIQTSEGVEVFPIVPMPNQHYIQQSQLHPFTWPDYQQHHTPVDLEIIEEVHQTVKRPVDVRQENLFAVTWVNGSRSLNASDDVEWDGDKMWEEIIDDEEGNQKDLPLPWEGRRRGPVPFDGKTVGPSWAQKDGPPPLEQEQQQKQAASTSGANNNDKTTTTPPSPLPLVASVVTRLAEVVKNSKFDNLPAAKQEEVTEGSTSSAATAEQQQQGDNSNNKKQKDTTTASAKSDNMSNQGQSTLEPGPRKKEEKDPKVGHVKQPEEVQADVEKSRPLSSKMKNLNDDKLVKRNVVYPNTPALQQPSTASSPSSSSSSSSSSSNDKKSATAAKAEDKNDKNNVNKQQVTA